jgi:transposase
MSKTTYITEDQYRLLRTDLLFVKSKKPRKYEGIEIIDAIFYLIDNSLKWRALSPKIIDKWEAVYYYIRKWNKEGLLDYILEEINKIVRRKELGYSNAKIGIIDSSSVSNTNLPEETGYDGHKKVKGIKRFLVSDELGLIIGIKAIKANCAEVNGAKIVLTKEFKQLNYSVEEVFGDKGFVSKSLEYSCSKLRIAFRAIPKKGYIKLKSEHTIAVNIHNQRLTIAEYITKRIKIHRWKVERTFAWLQNFRRFSMNYERKLSISETMVKLAGIRIALGKLRD